MLEKIRKLPANRVCANCPEESRLGFDAVCVKFSTFVCHKCKSAHQSFSHRVKSVGMSNWTQDEVDKLRKQNGGGNDVARSTFLANLRGDSKRRYALKLGATLDEHKRFVEAAYIRKKFYGDATLKSSASSNKGGKSSRKSKKANPAGAAKKKRSPKPATPQSNEPDMLDFGFGSPANASNGNGNVIGSPSAASMDLLGSPMGQSGAQQNNMFQGMNVNNGSSNMMGGMSGFGGGGDLLSGMNTGSGNAMGV